MKKLISIIAALSMIASLSVTSFAAIDVAVSEKDAAKATLAKQDDGSFTADLATDSNTSQDTIVVVKGDGSTISTTSIEYINQDVASQNFNFVLKNTPDSVDDFKADPADENETVASGATLTYTVLMGGDTVSKTEVGTITYTYTKDVVKYTVTFVGTDGTTPVIEAAQYEKAADIVLPSEEVTATITKAEDENYTYAFAGWATTAGATEAIDVNAYALTADVTFYPVFTATAKVPEGGEDTSAILSYQMVLVATNGSTVDATVTELTVNSGEIIYDKATEPTLNGYSFIGWYTDDALTTKLAKDATLTATTTIYAKMAKSYVRGNLDQDANGIINKADATVLAEWVGKRKPAHDWLGKTVPGSTEVFGNIDGDVNNIVNKADATVLAEWVGKRKPAGTNYADVIAVTKD